MLRPALILLLGSVGTANAASEKVLYSFNPLIGDGYYPYAEQLLKVGGILYGSTEAGGANGYGTLFKVTKAGIEKVLYSFANGNDGAAPRGGLIKVNGILYGTASEGGNPAGSTGCGGVGCGVAFKSTTAGNLSGLYSFKGDQDGGDPVGSLIDAGGTFYGTTFGDTTNGENGTVFKLTKSGVETVLYSFGAINNDGANPHAKLINVGGIFYGTTVHGGGTGCELNSGCGTVFKVTLEGVETVLHAFAGPNDAYPASGLINVNGSFYGTTTGYGAGGGYGTVFKITPAGDYTVLYTFSGGKDGGSPGASLLNVGGTLYGTTYGGGSSNCNAGCGTVFKATKKGAETVVHTFTSGSDGAYPSSALIEVGSKLYGTTLKGGGSGCSESAGCGTIFEITP
jgi:uncharacterized repeat protein (TIGR03803 family)